MDYRLSWPATLLVLAIGVAAGAGGARLIQGGAGRTLWASCVALAFIAASGSAVIFDFSWMFTDASRTLAQMLALGLLTTGLVYAARAPG